MKKLFLNFKNWLKHLFTKNEVKNVPRPTSERTTRENEEFSNIPHEEEMIDESSNVSQNEEKQPDIYLIVKDPWKENSLGCEKKLNVMNAGAKFVELNVSGRNVRLKDIFVKLMDESGNIYFSGDQIKYRTKVGDNSWSKIHTDQIGFNQSLQSNKENNIVTFSLEQTPSPNIPIWISVCSGNCNVRPSTKISKKYKI